MLASSALSQDEIEKNETPWVGNMNDKKGIRSRIYLVSAGSEFAPALGE